jgi:hypothetical protein
MKKRQIIILVSLLTVVISVSACGCLGGGTKSKKAAPEPVAVQPATPTEGQQFMDLKKAHDEGAITDEEFQRAKEKLLKEGEQPTKEVAEQPKQEQKESGEKAEEKGTTQ